MVMNLRVTGQGKGMWEWVNEEFLDQVVYVMNQLITEKEELVVANRVLEGRLMQI